ncbi:30S ribosomal protein S19e [Caldiplasma sukawensis]
MVNIKQVPPKLLIEKMKEELQKDEKISEPEWTKYLKAGSHREKSWTQDDWYYRRLASTLRKVYVKGKIGIQKISSDYGGKRDKGSAMYHPVEGSRYIIRKMFQKLEELGYLEKTKEGRKVTPKGEAFMHKCAENIMKDISEKMPEIKKYL